ncbi:MAG: ribose-phosphate diphosphokinase, partial [Armatimonadetes bacterium]|nr:ribose-phosphate diphosphokinase [Armatimonadota bacterium]
MQHGEFKVFSGTANRPLSQEIADYLRIPLGKVHIERFADGEIYVRYDENARGVDAFVVQPLCHPVNENLLELLIMIDALRRASADRITAVIPYYAYARQDRKSAPREPITARLIADLLMAAGINRVLTMDLDADQIEGFFTIPVDHLRALPLFAEALSVRRIENAVVVAPDDGAVKQAKRLADRLSLPLAVVFQRRTDGAKAPVQLVGEVAGRTPILIDRIIATAGTVETAIEMLVEAGARREMYVCATHAVLAPPSLQRLERPEIR